MAGVPRPIHSSQSIRRHIVVFSTLLFILLLSQSSSVHAFVPLTLDEVVPKSFGLVQKWNLDALPNGTIPYWINLNRPPGATPVEPTDDPRVITAKVRNAFQAWANVPTARVRFSYQGLTNVTNKPWDGMNVVTFSPTGYEFPKGRPVWPEMGSVREPGPVTIGQGVVEAQFAGQILGCDFVINPFEDGAYWVGDTMPTANQRWDIQGYLTHEIGHCLGLDHTAVSIPSTMNIYAATGGGFTWRMPSADDKAGISALYPNEEFLRTRGSITGQILRENGSSVFGAHVVAVEAATGVIFVGTVSGVKEITSDGTPLRFAHGSGKYLLNGLPPGQYRVYAEPMDHLGNTLCCVWDDRSVDPPRYQIMEKDFQPTFYTGTVTVTAGQTASGIDIVVKPRNSDAPVLDRAYYILDGLTRKDPVLAHPGTQLVMGMSVGHYIANYQGLLPGTTFTFVGPGIAVNRTQFVSFPLRGILLFLSIAKDAAVGPRVLQVSNDRGTGFFSGALTVVSDAPMIHSVGIDSSGRVVIDGRNFATETTVHFEDLTLPNVVVESSTRVRAETPGMKPGQSVRVAVIHLGGTASETVSLQELKLNKFNVEVAQRRFDLKIRTVSSVSGFNFSQADKALRFTLSGATGTVGFADVTFPKVLLNGTFTVTLDDASIAFQRTENSTHYTLFVSYSHSSHVLAIKGTTVVPEFPIPPLVAFFVLLLAISGMRFARTRARIF